MLADDGWGELDAGAGLLVGTLALVAFGCGGYLAGRLAGRRERWHGVLVAVSGVTLATMSAVALEILGARPAVEDAVRSFGLPAS